MHDTLELSLILLAVAVVVVVVFRLLRLPALIGYLCVGIVIGPHALAWIPDEPDTRSLAQFGVVFLMFAIGLDFSLPRLLSMRRIVFGLGSAQVLSVIAVVELLCLAGGLSWRVGIVLGGTLAMSSTAILGKMLSERLELNSQHGRQVMGVLLLQDLAVVPLLLLVPALSGSAQQLAQDLTSASVKAAVLLVLVLNLGQRILKPWFHLVARQKSPELFMLNLLLFTLGLAWLSGQLGLSYALGAFLAGMLISETPYRYQVENDIRPFQDVLLGLFFVTVGMQLNPAEVAGHAVAVALALLGLVLLKTGLTAGLARLFGAEPGTALRVGLALCAAGEFGLVLLSQPAAKQLIGPHLEQVVLAAMILSMLAAPFILEHSEPLVRRFSRSEWMARAMALHNIAARTLTVDRHVVLCGYGRSGQSLARLLEQEQVPFIALDLDPQRVKEAAAAGESVVFGDAGRREVLAAAGVKRAAALVVCHADTRSALRILELAHELRPGLPVVVRTRDETDIDQLREAGASEVVPEIVEGSLMLASHVLMLTGVPFNRVLRRIRETRESRYSQFRGFFRGATDDAGDIRDGLQLRLHSVTLESGANAVGRTLEEMALAQLRVEVTAVRRRTVREREPDPSMQLAVGDVLVLRGLESDLGAAESRIVDG